MIIDKGTDRFFHDRGQRVALVQFLQKRNEFLIRRLNDLNFKPHIQGFDHELKLLRYVRELLDECIIHIAIHKFGKHLNNEVFILAVCIIQNSVQ